VRKTVDAEAVDERVAEEVLKDEEFEVGAALSTGVVLGGTPTENGCPAVTNFPSMLVGAFANVTYSAIVVACPLISEVMLMRVGTPTSTNVVPFGLLSVPVIVCGVTRITFKVSLPSAPVKVVVAAKVDAGAGTCAAMFAVGAQFRSEKFEMIYRQRTGQG
jgi:hypothetical protein